MSRIDDLLEHYPPLMTAKEVADLLGVTERTVLRWLNESELPGIRYPRRGWAVVRDELRDWLINAHNIRGSADARQDHQDQEEARE